MWKQSIYPWGDPKPRAVIERTNRNVVSQRESILLMDGYYIVVVDEPGLLVALTKNLTEVWVYQKT